MILHWNVDPILVHLGPLQVRYYGLLFVIAFFIGLKFFRTIFAEDKLPQTWVDSLLSHMLIGTIAGARLGHCLFYDFSYYVREPWKILYVWEGGLASHGAAVGIFFSLYLYCRKTKLSWLWLVDRDAIPVACAGFFIRMGNFFNSEIIGKPTNGDFGIVFDRIDSVPRYPSQLMESIFYGIFAVILYRLFRKNDWGKYRGALFGLFLIGVFGFRFLIEFLKEVQVESEKGLVLDYGQIYSIPLIIAGVVLLVRAFKIGIVHEPLPKVRA